MRVLPSAMLKPRRKTNRGVALVEFALVLPFLLILLFITAEFGRALYQYNILTKSVRDAVRFMSVRAPGEDLQAARNMVVFGNPAGTGRPLATGLALTHVPEPTWQSSGGTPGFQTVTVRISGYRFTSTVTGAFGLPFGDFTYSDISATMRAAL